MPRQHVTPDMVRDARTTIRPFTDAQQHDADLAFRLTHLIERASQAHRRAKRANWLLYGGMAVALGGLGLMWVDLAAGLVTVVVGFAAAIAGQELAL